MEAPTVRGPLLVVDDDRVFGRALGKALRPFFPAVVVVSREADALERMADGTPFAAALLDVDMPGRGGIGLADAIRASARPCVVALMTAGELERHPRHAVVRKGDRLSAFLSALGVVADAAGPAAASSAPAEGPTDFGEEIATRLRALRREYGIGQHVVARAVGTSISAVSRLERGMRRLRVDQLVAWAGALGLRVEVVIWRPTFFDEAWDSERSECPLGLDDASSAILEEVASALPHLPETARKAVAAEMREWRQEAMRRRGVVAA